MSLAEKINNDIKAAMLARDKRKLEALRAIKAAILLEQTGRDTSTTEVPETVELKILQRLVKQRKESAEIYKSKDRTELAEEELFQASIIEAYLPEQMGPDELKVKIEAIVQGLGAESMKDMGRVMGEASKQLAGKADNKSISSLVREILQK